jgi:hypothetical protein
MAGTYVLNLEEGEAYWVRLSSHGSACISPFVIMEVIPLQDACCPEEYTLAPDGSYCYKVEETAATPPGAAENAVAVSNAAYCTCGSYIYTSGWASNGTGTSAQISLSNPFWVNGAGACADSTTTDGPLNRSGIWASGGGLTDQDVGFGVCLNIPATKTYYVGVGADNYAIIKLDSVTLITQDPTALAAQYGVGAASTFKVWHIYPIEIAAGPHILEILGHNVSGAASIGCEVYDATSAELIAATSYAALGSKLVFSSKDYVGQPIQLGTDGVGYSCPVDYSLDICSGPATCKKFLTTATISC